MAAKATIRRSDAGAIIRLRKALEDPSRLLKRIGITLLMEAESAFAAQGLGDIQWPERYPNQGEPFINVAGAVSDLSKGANIKARRFDRRPALSDTGALLRSLAPRGAALRPAGRYSVEVGSTLPYAGLHQWGGESEQPITSSVKSNLKSYLQRSRNRTKRAKGQGKPIKSQDAAAQRLGFLFKVDVLTTKVVKRPFLGITDEAEQKIVNIIEEGLTGGGK